MMDTKKCVCIGVVAFRAFCVQAAMRLLRASLISKSGKHTNLIEPVSDISLPSGLPTCKSGPKKPAQEPESKPESSAPSYTSAASPPAYTEAASAPAAYASAY